MSDKKIIPAKNRDEALVFLGAVAEYSGLELPSIAKLREGYEPAFDLNIQKELRGLPYLELGHVKTWYKK